MCAHLLRGIELVRVECARGDANCAVAFDRRTKFQAVQSDFELHQFRLPDFADGCEGLRQLVLANQLAHLHRIPGQTARLALQQISPGSGRFFLRKEQKCPRFRSGRVVGLAKRRRAKSRRSFRRIRQHINAETVGKVIHLVTGAINGFLQRDEPGQLCKQFRRFQGRVQFFQFGEELFWNNGRVSALR